MVNPEDAKLLDLHLTYIEKYTDVPYTIYGSINRLLPQFRQKLAQHPQVRICDCPETDKRGAAEHAFYLELLTKYAIDDGASHIITMHVDSFPVRHHWAEDLAAKLSPSCVFATIENINTACLFFTREFYIQYHPAFTLTPKEHASSQYRQYQKKYNANSHSGIGYGFKAYTEGLSFYYLRESTKSDDAGKIYDDIIFHLIGAIHFSEWKAVNIQILGKAGFVKMVEKITLAAKSIIPKRQREWLRKIFRLPIDYFIDRPRGSLEKAKLRNRTKELFADPEAYLQRLRSSHIRRGH
jgi:hypothetical protein